MILPFTIVLLAVACLVGLVCVALGLAGRKPDDLTVLSVALVGVLVIAQVVIAIVAPWLVQPRLPITMPKQW